MKILFYSIQSFEKPYIVSANHALHDVSFTEETLTAESAHRAKGYDGISIFTGDNADAHVLQLLLQQGIHFIAIRATGFDNVNVKVANELGIKVANVPGYSPHAIAELAVALMLCLNRKIVTADKQVHQHDFTVSKLVGFDLHGKTAGIVGVGRIGGTLARILHGFGCRLLGYDVLPDKELQEECGVEYVSLPVLCRDSDIISVHTCLTPSTKYIINEDLIAVMKQSVILINTSRGACVDTAVVSNALERGRIGAYGADVYEYEKGIFFHDHSAGGINDALLKRLLALPNVLITPHQGFATAEALGNIAAATFSNIDCWANRKVCSNELYA